jgi:hypothetical protein
MGDARFAARKTFGPGTNSIVEDRVMRERFLASVFAVFCVLLSATSVRADDVFDIISIERPSANVEIVHIRQPNVKKPMTEYPQITFTARDSVVVSADGCVQTGGAGATWKRYVNPSGGDSERYYFGEIWIPGATGVLAPIAGVVNRTIVVPVGSSTAGSFLRLGYSDSQGDYGDNGYWGHDNGTENQCAGAHGGAAEVTLTITHNAVTAAPAGDVAPFDLFWDAVDANAIPLGARWGEQINHDRNPASHPTGLAGDLICATPWLLPCTTQAPSLDGASFPNSWVSCDHLGGPLNGHANWGPGTYEGALSWESKSDAGDDDDYSINLSTLGNAGATEGRPEGYHIEFDSNETIDNFGSSWWHTLQHAVDNENTFPTPQDLLNNDFAIVTGLVDLDCAHPCSGELHPVYALALRQIFDTRYELWALFVRNWGNEGGCSSDDHPLFLANNQYTVMLPWSTGATSVTFGKQTTFLTNTAAASMPPATILPGVGVQLTFNLPPPGDHGLIDGVVELSYGGPPAKPAPSPALPGRAVAGTLPIFAIRAPEDDDRFPPMTAAQLKVFRAHLPTNAHKPNARKLALAAPQTMTALAWQTGHARRGIARPVPVVKAVAYPAKLARDMARVKALYAAFGGTVPGLGPMRAAPGISGRTSGAIPAH